jgi:hypothetical protein
MHQPTPNMVIITHHARCSCYNKSHHINMTGLEKLMIESNEMLRHISSSAMRIEYYLLLLLPIKGVVSKLCIIQR